MLDLNLFREEKGNDPEIIRESQRKRFNNVEVVDEIIQLDKEWRQRQFELEQLKRDFIKLNKQVAKMAKHKIVRSTNIYIITYDRICNCINRFKARVIKYSIVKKDTEVEKAWTELSNKLETVGNMVHDSVPVSNDEGNNEIVRTWGENIKRTEPSLLNHVELVKKLGIVDTKTGAEVAGKRGFFLKGDGVLLNQALINFGLDFLVKRNYTAMQTPFFMKKDIMGKCAQLAQFDDELYKVTGEGEDKYLIATAEQPLCAYHIKDWIHPSELPIRYAGYSTCFRKEVGSHGKDTLGIFRVHQFEKIEQFCITSPEDSWKMHEEMIKNAEEFYRELELPYQIVNIVSGALNDAAAKKYDLEAWFPASGKYKELVSCSNCTDYQARNLEIRYGQKKGNDQTKQYCHLLNSTLTATERTLRCILENNQKKDGVEIPKVLQPYMNNRTKLFFPESPPKKTKGRNK
uniref:serine--tRNA ligase-like n=1 Tax=Erigeron canadensis TaxID=72917 RepID=UPI001CB90061|nr:serine--tRNA ligase-like [Erigeron canadensis]